MIAVETFIKHIYLMVGVMRSSRKFRIICIGKVWNSKEPNVKSTAVFRVSVLTKQ